MSRSKLLALLLINLISSPLAFSTNNTFETTLSNGLKVIVREDKRAPVIVSQIWYKVGASYEHNGITGISHMLEHMMFKATRNLADGEFNKIIAENGGSQNAFTSFDYTGYYQILRNDKLALSLRLEADRMSNLLFDDKTFQKEREVVAEERRMRTEDNPNSNLFERFMSAAHISNPYHHPVVGWMNDIQNYQLADLKNWYQKWYAPNNAILVIVGDVDHNKVFKLVDVYFGKLKKRAVPNAKPRREIPPLGTRTLKVNIPAKVPSLILGFNTPSFTTAEDKRDLYALDVINAILSGGASSRLADKLVRSQQLATECSTSFDSFMLHETLFIAACHPHADVSVEKLQQAMMDELKLLQTKLVSQQELERVKAQIYTGRIYQRDSLQAQAYEIGALEAINISYREAEEYDHNLQQVTANQIQQVAKKYFNPERLTVAELVPLEVKH